MSHGRRRAWGVWGCGLEGDAAGWYCAVGLHVGVEGAAGFLLLELMGFSTWSLQSIVTSIQHSLLSDNVRHRRGRSTVPGYSSKAAAVAATTVGARSHTHSSPVRALWVRAALTWTCTEPSATAPQPS